MKELEELLAWSGGRISSSFSFPSSPLEDGG